MGLPAWVVSRDSRVMPSPPVVRYCPHVFNNFSTICPQVDFAPVVGQDCTTRSLFLFPWWGDPFRYLFVTFLSFALFARAVPSRGPRSVSYQVIQDIIYARPTLLYNHARWLPYQGQLGGGAAYTHCQDSISVPPHSTSAKRPLAVSGVRDISRAQNLVKTNHISL